MKLHFDANQDYQLEAIEAVTRVWEGQPLAASDFEFTHASGPLQLTENGFGNRLAISPEQVWENVKAIQAANGISRQDPSLQGMHFTIEMETGTGKTYVYLRTIYELNKLYGFRKFVIVVPSIAIREGVIKNLEITHEHFQSLYGRCPVAFDVYDSKNIPQLRSFAAANTVQILVINIDAFAKNDNIINRPNDASSGRKPIAFIQSCRPVVIIDEPQNMETPLRKKAISSLTPLFTLRYSATHINLYNLLYSLNPVKAYDLGLVKQIEVDAVLSTHAMNDAYLKLQDIRIARAGLSAILQADVNTAKGPVRKNITVKTGDDLYRLTRERESYKNGYIVEAMDATEGSLSFCNGIQLQTGQTRGGMNEAVTRFMLQRTIEEHLKKELRLQAKGIKVLSLFFIDKVKNYREYDEQGNIRKGKYALWFEAIFKQEINKPAYRQLYASLGPASDLPDMIHGGYFAQDNKGRVKDTNGETQADDTLYRLIMQGKEQLLDPDTPLRFIFSHSALREGWDNPNVFQVCTLNETKSDIKKRQEIGRGLRLAVNRYGQRMADRDINKLTVIANESYEDFAKTLQNEMEQDCGVSFEGRIKDKSRKQKIQLRQDYAFDPRFLDIWNKIKFRTRYQVSYNTENLVYHAAEKLKRMPHTLSPSMQSSRAKIFFHEQGIGGQLLSNATTDTAGQRFPIPDVLGYIQSRTGLTRKTIFNILQQSGRIKEIFINPQLFMDNAVTAIKSPLQSHMVDGIQYEKIAGETYAMTLFNDEEMEVYPDSFTFNVSNPDKTIYENHIALDSNLEHLFAKDCESSENVEFYMKLPRWFKINTPIGSYNPDWAIVYRQQQKLYFVTETKGAGQELRESEQMKIECGRAHFSSLHDVQYEQVSALSDLVHHLPL